jgi:predicted nicotinamide N-methyase
VWDSAIVLSKLLEKKAETLARGRSAVELGSGCGLLSLVLSHLGARVTVTDLECNLPLLRDNVSSNGSSATVEALSWGAANARRVRAERNGGLPFDVIVASDVMYIPECVPLLVATLKELCCQNSDIFLAYGRNRTAEESFLLAAERAGFTATTLEAEELHEVYNCLDVTVLRLKLALGGTRTAD